MNKTCPKCKRTLDRHWDECPYCKREREANAKSNPEPKPVEINNDEENKVTDKNQRGPTRVDQPATRRETKYEVPAGNQYANASPNQSVASKVKAAADNRRIVGVLATYTWKREGEIHAVREGRTHIGAGKIKDDPDHRPVEVCCQSDDLLSADHTLILVQNKKFFIQDLASVNGTFVNGEQLVPEMMSELPNNAEIKAGNTIFTFLRIDAKNTATIAEPARDQQAQQEKSRRDLTEVK